MATTYYVASSLDGFVADPDDGLDWLLQFGFDAFSDHYERFLAGVGAIVMGSSTYEWLLREGSPWPYTLPTWVFTSRDLPAPSAPPGASRSGPDVRFVSGDVADLHPGIADVAGDRDVWVVGGGILAAQYQQAGLLDELRVTVMPVALGRGKPLLPVAAPTAVLDLVDTTTFAGGAVELHYTSRSE